MVVVVASDETVIAMVSDGANVMFEEGSERGSKEWGERGEEGSGGGGGYLACEAARRGSRGRR